MPQRAAANPSVAGSDVPFEARADRLKIFDSVIKAPLVQLVHVTLSGYSGWVHLALADSEPAI